LASDNKTPKIDHLRGEAHDNETLDVCRLKTPKPTNMAAGQIDQHAHADSVLPPSFIRTVPSAPESHRIMSSRTRGLYHRSGIGSSERRRPHPAPKVQLFDLNSLYHRDRSCQLLHPCRSSWFGC